MRGIRATALAVAVVAFVAFVTSAGATSHQASIHFDLSTRAGVEQYVKSLGLDARSVVIQRGLRNYAGSSCPGSGWTCTSTSRPVVQIASAAGRNVFQCSGSRCAVVQTSTVSVATNTATCVRTTGITQSCSITQSSASADNQAIVFETANKVMGFSQSASQTAQIVQQATGASNGNTACVNQTLTLSSATKEGSKAAAANLSLDAHQAISITQDAASGPNVVENATSTGCGAAGSALTQSQTITQVASALKGITQNQNAAATGPNSLIDIQQNQSTPTASGINTSNFNQTNTLTSTAYTPAGPVTQTQSSPGGGLKATVNQFSTGVSTSTTNQTETQTEHAQKSVSDAALPPGTTQTQYGPMVCCSVQASNDDDVFTIIQSSTQTNDTEDTQTNTVSAAVTTSGDATATQTTNVDGQTTTNEQSVTDGGTINTQTSCSGSSCSTPDLSISPTSIEIFGGFPAFNTQFTVSGCGYTPDSSGTLSISELSPGSFPNYFSTALSTNSDGCVTYGPTAFSDPIDCADTVFTDTWTFTDAQGVTATTDPFTVTESCNVIP